MPYVPVPKDLNTVKTKVALVLVYKCGQEKSNNLYY